MADRIRVCDEDALVLSTDLVLLGYILKDILKREPHEKVSIKSSDIMFSRLDKLLDHMNGMKEKDLHQAKNLQEVIDSVVLVQQSWHKRFQGRLSTIDQDRVRVLLDNVTFELSSKSKPRHPNWVARRNPSLNIEEIQLELGQ
jgi:hypothetical protein